ncbi:glycosyltransferase family 2 protein [Yoonia sp. I 8.24]|uniref:glycosyltransferase family 2 protein n=1 Tax=Yoonia sp. I 8.24 TaxID=1537229 RepID=UPI001EE11856|nr:glycosyltransferase family 2 protein [Yoonia sp. I 8.24]MCG3268366.1 glycosyltransferase family 2 protein [Yoonia sp. I 8.24]
MPRFSIVIPCYNAANTLVKTLDSIQAQTFSDWEIICVDDGSTDLTTDLIADAAKRDNRIKLAYNLRKGPSEARNLGAQHLSSGDIIAFCDADDIWAPEKLADLAGAFDDTKTHGAFGKIAFFVSDPQTARVFSTVPTGPLSIDRLLGENPVCTMSNLSIRKTCFVQTGGFDPSIVHNEDLEWLIRVVGQGMQIIGLDTFHTWYRTNPTGLSADLGAMQAGRRRALDTAKNLGFSATKRSQAVHLRYLARRALRLGLARRVAFGFAIAGLLQSPSGFLTPPRRGALTFIGALGNLVLPRRLSHALFSQ